MSQLLEGVPGQASTCRLNLAETELDRNHCRQVYTNNDIKHPRVVPDYRFDDAQVMQRIVGAVATNTMSLQVKSSPMLAHWFILDTLLLANGAILEFHCCGHWLFPINPISACATGQGWVSRNRVV